MADKDRGKITRASSAKIPQMVSERVRLGLDAGEAHTLDEWADLFEVDYYKLWSLREEMHMCIEDALLILTEKGAV